VSFADNPSPPHPREIVQLEQSRPQLRHVEQIADEAVEPFRFVLDIADQVKSYRDIERLALFRVGRPIGLTGNAPQCLSLSGGTGSGDRHAPASSWIGAVGGHATPS
jgi:hypothetical protein